MENEMIITEANELIGENEIMLTTNKGVDYFVSYILSRELIKAEAFEDYHTEPDYDENIIDIELIDCHVSNEDLDKLTEATDEQKEIIKEYLTIINK